MFSQYLNSFEKVLSETKSTLKDGVGIGLDDCFLKVNEILKETKLTGNRIYLVGNGGSSGIVSHAAVDFLNACGFKAHAITDNSLLTCIANDYGYENVFSQPLDTLIDENDVLIAVSSSGNSMNIVNACQKAKEKGAIVLSFSGFKSDNKLRTQGDYNFWLNDMHYGRVEIGHSLLIHYITDNLGKK
ncbi:MAG: SIS domain-containing protein [Bacteroidetes bacterium]|nr:MAG: SIS domain-containing protein [Bacteroidota bacterium]MBL1144643.1 SIS domain-containing protein [Bacteroidota bacterium]MCB0802185.1 SIS domain-containing protein [Flavobacteriales bacterium]NOG57438.1 SIS domain-containing protein [Bacteroidota bacterium]